MQQVAQCVRWENEYTLSAYPACWPHYVISASHQHPLTPTLNNRVCSHTQTHIDTRAHTLRIPEIHIMQNHKPVHPIVNKLKQMIHTCPHCICRHIIMLNTLMYATMYTPAAHCLPLFCAFLLHYVTKSLVLRTWKRLHLPLSSGEARSTRGRLFWSRVLATEWNAELLEASYFTMCLLEICCS